MEDMGRKTSRKQKIIFLLVIILCSIFVFGWFVRREAILYSKGIEEDFEKTFEHEKKENKTHMIRFLRIYNIIYASEWTKKLTADLLNFLNSKVAEIEKSKQQKFVDEIFNRVSDGKGLYDKIRVDINKINSIFPKKSFIVKIGSYLYQNTYVWRLQSIATELFVIMTEPAKGKEFIEALLLLAFKERLIFLIQDSASRSTNIITLEEMNIKIPGYNSSYATTYIMRKIL